MGTQGPKKPNCWVLGAFGGSGDAFSWTRKAKFLTEELKALSSQLRNLVRALAEDNDKEEDIQQAVDELQDIPADILDPKTVEERIMKLAPRTGDTNIPPGKFGRCSSW